MLIGIVIVDVDVYDNVCVNVNVIVYVYEYGYENVNVYDLFPLITQKFKIHFQNRKFDFDF